MPARNHSAPGTSSTSETGSPLSSAAATGFTFSGLAIRQPRGEWSLSADHRELAIGESYHIAPKTAHLIANRSDRDTRFLLVQGVGAYDFLRVGG